ncbi:type IX secretion system periplasmic lipoprotein PorW/SprE [Carboxylicivirga linearis]|uniref:Tetratricopeptide repeat protein n=1 Tax=Carboxylicivirga linearis TaxID=1628157 RepID=A0ABS5JSJ4_9BACT|nr:tetratricopeptide repeat protein [Carboxylicivirga linearis]MBS2097778.1 tetratricopeptide repeat protein [Carboxylicivirga linearis]
MIYRKTGFILTILLVLMGCSTKKNTWLSRNYHNLTAYYNVYFNGKEALNTGVKSIRDGYKNDYSQILPMFESSDKDAIGVATGNMERAIEKGGKLIKKHSIKAKPKKRSGSKGRSSDFYSKKEYNNWVDDAYLLIGKAQFYQHDFLTAIRTFQYVVREYNNTPAQYEGLIWLARAYTEYQDYIGALSALESYDLGGNAPIELYGDFMAAYANLLLKQNKYAEAIPYLKNNIADNKDRNQRIRFSYILGQLYLETNQRKEAAESFAYVAKASPDYEMTFNAKVRKASILHENADIATIKKELNKLKKDKKNKDYLDQIYWAFGQVAEQEDNDSEALQYYRLSVNSSIDNNMQKGQSYYDAAEIYYNRFDYPNAYYHYDSALVVLDEDFENYDILMERQVGLKELTENILIVQHEDSLQRLADMSEPVLYAYLDGIIETKRKEEEVRLEQERREQESDYDPFFSQNTQSSVSSNANGGKWYFYNQASKASGKSEFQKRWGKRKLEDNWRRSDKSKNMDEEVMPDDPFDMPDDPFADGSEGQTTDESEGKHETQASEASSGNIPTREQLLADIPVSGEARAASDDKIETSLMEMGLLFMDRLENYPKSIESLEDLLSRYPQGDMRDQALVALYNAYRLNNDQAGMASTRRRLETEFPDSRFVTYLNDPEFFDKLDKVKKEQDQAYQKTYEDFLFGRFNEVVSASSIAIASDDENPLVPKYYLLRALSEGKLGNVELFKNDLDSLVAKAPDSEESALAKQLLKHLKEGKTPVQGTLFAATPQGSAFATADSLTGDGESPEDQLQFIYTENEPYELVVMNIEPENVNRAIYNVADYNFSRYLLHDFELKEQTLINGSNAIIVSGFKNKNEAMDYFYSLRERPEFFKFDFFKDNITVLSETNAGKFYLSGLINEYIEFFNTYYLTPVAKKELDKVRIKEEEVPENNEAELVAEDSSEAKENTEPTEEEQQTTTEQEKESVATETEIPTEAAVAIPAEDSTKVEAPVEPRKRRSIYSYNADTTHYVLIIIEKTRMDYNRFKTIYTNFSRNKYGATMKVDLIEIGDNHRALKIEEFGNAELAKGFIEEVHKNAFLTRDIIRKEHYFYTITPSNFELFLKRPSLRSYERFYEDYY